MARPFFQRLFDVCTELMETLHRLPQPVIARSTAGVRRGLPARRRVRPRGRSRHARVRDAGRQDRPVLLDADGAAVARIGRKRALEMLLTGELIDAAAALEWGLVNRVVAGRSRRESTRWRRIAAREPADRRASARTRSTRRSSRRVRLRPARQAVMAMNARADDAQEGMCAFLEKRPPEWRGR